MSKQQTMINLIVEDFDDAVQQVVDVLHESDGIEGKTKVFYFCGWSRVGLGASAVLRDVAKLLKYRISCDDSYTRKHFNRIVHVDCSLWKNRRTIQRAIAEELNLHHIMPIFDRQDEEDDFRGVDESSRKEIASIGSLINRSLTNERFLIIFRYEGDEDIDLIECGIPAFGEGKLVWTKGGRFFQVKDKPGEIKLSAFDGIVITSEFDSGKDVDYILHEVAVRMIGDTGMDGINPETVLDCCLYSLSLTAQLPENSTGVGYGWTTHACNYWICDGLLGEDRAWEVSNVLYGVIPLLDCYSYGIGEIRYLAPFMDELISKRWCSVTSNKKGTNHISNVPHSASSYFLTFQGNDPVYVRNDLFQLASNNLRVLKLCNCSFDFAYPPFQCCHNLRFLWVDHCANTGKEQTGAPIFRDLLVFDLRFTNYVLLPQMIELMTNLRELNTKGIPWKTISPIWKKLKKLQKLRLTESSDVVTVDSCSSVDMMNLELLDLSGNTHLKSLPTLSFAGSLKILVLDGCSSLDQVALAMERAPPLLESFSFDGYGPAENWTHSIHLPEKELRLKSPIAPVEILKVTKISLDGCGRLQNLFLRALPCLEELDLSGTAIKTLDLLTMDVPKLKKLFLLGCEQLRSLIWHGSPRLEVVHVDTQRNVRSMISCGEQGSFDIEVCIAFTDGRFIWSSAKGLNYQTENVLSEVYLLISCMSRSEANITKSIKEIGSSRQGFVSTRSFLPYNDTAPAKDVACPSLVWNCRPLQTLNVHVEIGDGSYNLESLQDEVDFIFFTRTVESLHVHDNSSITVIPPTKHGLWSKLKWCHVERCSKLQSLFCYRRVYDVSFACIRTFSACDLLSAYFIWGKGINTQDSTRCFQQLQHIYLYNCPRLVFVLPISFTLPNLETLQIAYCSSLQHVFPLDDEYPESIASGATFNNLKEIKLHHLHKLEQICEARLTAPALQAVGIRDCWAFRRIPIVAHEGPKPLVDCEKDLWDSLEWDGLDAGHHPSLFETRHSAYCKKTLPRGSYLR
uniref:Disease resistance protein At4g27190-like leucine-rich repeats domain-containing protein n=1 Tax=Hordeum vulgare subsp. vulgare TaxID=112509 RepID=A0A8I6Z1Y0_HORVV